MANDKDKKKVKDPRYDIYTTGTNITDTFGGWDDRINNNQETNVEIPREFPKENPYSDRAAIQAAVQQQALNNRLQPNNQEIPDRQRAVFPSNIPPSVGFAVSSNEQEMRNAINGKNGMASPANAPQVSPQVQTPGRNPYADRAAVQAAIESQAAQPLQQQPYNLFAQQKQTGYPNTTTPNTGPRVGTDEKPASVSKPLVSSGGEQRKPIPITNTDELARAMGYTSPEEEERMRKASLANMRIMAVADAIRHIGNIVHTTNGAPAQKLTSAVQDEYDRYRKGKALRDAANYKYLSYQQQKAAQDAKFRQMEADRKQKAKQWEADFNLKVADAARKAGYTEAQIQNMKDKLAQQQAYQNANLELGKGRLDETIRANKARQESTDRHQRVMESQGWSRINETKRHNSVVERRGSGKNSTTTVHSRRGYLTKDGISEQDMKRVYDNLYEWGKSKGYIKNNSKLPEAYAALEDQKMSDVRKREAVNKLIMEHDDAAVLLHSKYGFDWHEQKPNDKALGIGIGSENEKGKSLGLGL